MRVSDNLPIMIALPLALMAALMSGNAQTRHAVSVFLAKALIPQPEDIGGNPGYLSGRPDQAVWPLPPRPVSLAPSPSHDLVNAAD